MLGEKESEVQQLRFELSALRGDLDNLNLLVKENKRDLEGEREAKNRLDQENSKQKTSITELKSMEANLRRELAK